MKCPKCTDLLLRSQLLDSTTKADKIFIVRDYCINCDYSDKYYVAEATLEQLDNGVWVR